MVTRINSCGVWGVEPYLVGVEVDIRPGLAVFSIVGLGDRAVAESRDRVMTAIRSSGFEFPPRRITVNLSPSHLRKAGSGFDLAIAMGILLETNQIRAPQQDEISASAFLGALSLDGTVSPVRGVIGGAEICSRRGIRKIFLAPEAARAAAAFHGIRPVPVAHLREAAEILQGLRPVPDPPAPLRPPISETALDFSDVRGQTYARRALEIAAAGGHHLLMVGPPGCGKTMLAKRLPTILPPLSPEESLEVSRIWSAAGRLDGGLITRPPFRAPHHTITLAALLGGGAGSAPFPGEISLAHRGVLLLDEFPEFERRGLEALREPLEEGRLVLSRSSHRVRYPAEFLLLATANHCPCGWLAHPTRRCVCQPHQIRRYRQKLSGPLADRIDLQVEMSPVKWEELERAAPAETSESIRARVLAAREIQARRYAGLRGLRLNCQLRGRLLRRFAAPPPECRPLLARAFETGCLSARGYEQVLRVARTIADLEGSAQIAAPHLAEAIGYRSLDRRSQA